MPPLILRNRYRVVGRLGSGGGGSVYEVEDLRTAKVNCPRLALKALFSGNSQPALLAMLRQEFRVLASLWHPLLARVHDFGSIPMGNELDGSEGRAGYFFTRDLIDGLDLEKFSQNCELITVCLVLQKTAQVLDVLHRSGMVHGDFKPANVIVDRDGCPHLIDFGLVRGEGMGGAPSGTMPYLAPEMLDGRIVDRRADLYSFGISAYQLLTGKLPLPEASASELIAWHLEGEPVSVSSQVKVPNELDALVYRLTQRDPDHRYPSAAEVELVLGRVAKALGVQSAPLEKKLFVPPAAGENLSFPLARLEEYVRNRTNAEPGPALVCVVGEPGSGKTRLARELTWRSQLSGVEVVGGAFLAGDPRAYGLLTDLFSQVAAIAGVPSPLEQPKFATQPKTFSIGPSEFLIQAESSSTGDQYALYQKIAEFLKMVASRFPLLLVLDNTEHADKESCDVLRYLAHTLEQNIPVLLLVAYRANEEVVDLLGDSPVVELPPLSVEDLERMVAEASQRPDKRLAHEIHRHTDGNPLFVKEVLQKLFLADWPTNPDLQKLVPPYGIEEMYQSRWRELGDNEKDVLAGLAIMGRPTSSSVLMKLLETEAGSDLGTVGLPLERLEDQEWLIREPQGAWIFRQGSASSVVYGWLDAKKKQRLHLAAASLLEDQHLVEKTRHFFKGGASDRGLEILNASLIRLKKICAHGRAIELCEDALAGLNDADDRRRWLHQELGQLCLMTGQHEKAARSLELAMDGALGKERCLTAISLARAYRALGNANLGMRVLELCLEEDISKNHRLALMAAQAATLTALDAHEDVLQVVDRALETTVKDNSTDKDLVVCAELRCRKARSLAYLNRYQEAKEVFQTALFDAKKVGDKRVEAEIHNAWAVAAHRQADYGNVAQNYDETLACARETGDVVRIAETQLNQATFHLQRGEYAICLSLLPSSRRLFEAMGADYTAAAARCNEGFLELKLGLFEKARATLEKTAKEMRSLGRPSGEALTVLLLALVDAGQSKIKEARQGISEARRLYKEVRQERDAADALLDLADVELRAGELGNAKEALDLASSEVNLEQLPDLNVRAICLRASLIAKTGNDAQRFEVARELENALDLAQCLDSVDLKWNCHAAAMDLAEANGQPVLATEHATMGFHILEQMATELPSDARVAFWLDERRRVVRQRASFRSIKPRKSTQENVSMNIATDMTLAGGVTLSVHTITERFYRLLEIYRRINSELNRERLLGLVMDTAVELTGAERGFLLLGETAEDLKLEVARNLNPDKEAGAYSRSIAERVFRTGRPVITVSARNDPRFSDFPSVHELQLESVLCIPVHTVEGVCGVLYMESRFQSGRFTSDDQRILMAFGDQVAISLTNARLLADNIRKANELQEAKERIEALAEELKQLLEERTEQLEMTKQDLVETRKLLESRVGMFGLVGRSKPMHDLFELVERVSGAEISVLIEGESGTGKEMVARAIHNNSARCKGRLVSVNCAAIPENLLESELFGHVRGAFTGADRERRGLFLAANKGTLFLDEIGDMPMRMQVDLLRALQEKVIRPVGGEKDIKVDVRVVAATNRPLQNLVREKLFREDLFYRLNVVQVVVPPLRERVDDIPLLVDHFLSVIAAQMKAPKKDITRRALHLLMANSWPGNVRQLEHALMNAVILSDGITLDVGDFSLGAPSLAKTGKEFLKKGKEIEEKQQIIATLERFGGNKTKAAQSLNMARRTFYRRLMEYNLN
ncbi:MAG: sigma 54-interacting transcriptional regulator [Pseudomonadota bacterium]